MKAVPVALPPDASWGVLWREAGALLRRSRAPSPAWQAEMLGALVLGCSRLEARLARDTRPDTAARRRYETLLVRAAGHEPLAYLEGRVDFMQCSLRCDRRALIPRPETEELVERILASEWVTRQPAAEVVDVGTGGGCIALALACALPTLRVTGIDRAPGALSLARENAASLGLLGRTRWLQGDLLAGWPQRSCDVVVANLPYVSDDAYALLPPSVRGFEPPAALRGGRDGLDAIRALIPQARKVLRPGGWIFLEIGAEQARAVTGLLAAAGYSAPRAVRDLRGVWRIAQARVPEEAPGHV